MHLEVFGCETSEEFCDLFEGQDRSPKEAEARAEQETGWHIMRDDLGVRHYWTGNGWHEEPDHALCFHCYNGKSGHYWALQPIERRKEEYADFKGQWAQVVEQPESQNRGHIRVQMCTLNPHFFADYVLLIGQKRE